ncbi:hypothetical protein A5906_09645 [Bradyrhizobium sacchari]|nr:hypothetical protein A5906_09645 [Bradyrhizobium sacchari]
MSAIKAIVSAYVCLRNQQALEEMRDLRRQLLESVCGAANEYVLDDIRLIEDGLAQLRQTWQEDGTEPTF